MFYSTLWKYSRKPAADYYCTWSRSCSRLLCRWEYVPHIYSRIKRRAISSLIESIEKWRTLCCSKSIFFSKWQILISKDTLRIEDVLIRFTDIQLRAFFPSSEEAQDVPALPGFYRDWFYEGQSEKGLMGNQCLPFIKHSWCYMFSHRDAAAHDGILHLNYSE